MSKVLKYASAYILWIVGSGFVAWLFYLGRTVLLGLLALSGQVGEWQFAKTVNLIDRVVTVVLGLGWLAFVIITEDYFRKAVKKGNLLRRFARITGPVLLCIFIVDLVFFWLQGISSDNWLRWLILATELGGGIALVVAVGKTPIIKSN
jgi:uncharacterized membrane protein